MTNTTKSPTTRQRFAATSPDAYVGSPFTRPVLVAGAMKELISEPIVSQIGASISGVVEELIREGLAEEFMTTLGGRGGYVRRVRLSAEGKALRARARRAELLVLNGLL